MHALLFDGRLRLANDYPEPALAPGEALIRPTLVGVCNTDVEITRGYMGFQGVLGHEFVGVVAACDDPAWVGRRVVGEINAACREILKVQKLTDAYVRPVAWRGSEFCR